MKDLRFFTVWLLPVIIIGGIVFPMLGFLVLGMMILFLPMSYFKKRYWCWHLCPRGAFLDIVLSRVSKNKPLPSLFSKHWFRWTVFLVFMGFFALRLLSADKNILAIGSVFVIMCLLTTLIAAALGVFMKHRAWCAVCPMGFLQEKIGSIRNNRKGGI